MVRYTTCDFLKEWPANKSTIWDVALCQKRLDIPNVNINMDRGLRSPGIPCRITGRLVPDVSRQCTGLDVRVGCAAHRTIKQIGKHEWVRLSKATEGNSTIKSQCVAIPVLLHRSKIWVTSKRNGLMHNNALHLYSRISDGSVASWGFSWSLLHFSSNNPGQYLAYATIASLQILSNSFTDHPRLQLLTLHKRRRQQQQHSSTLICHEMWRDVQQQQQQQQQQHSSTLICHEMWKGVQQQHSSTLICHEMWRDVQQQHSSTLICHEMWRDVQQQHSSTLVCHEMWRDLKQQHSSTLICHEMWRDVQQQHSSTLICHEMWRDVPDWTNLNTKFRPVPTEWTMAVFMKEGTQKITRQAMYVRIQGCW